MQRTMRGSPGLYPISGAPGSASARVRRYPVHAFDEVGMVTDAPPAPDTAPREHLIAVAKHGMKDHRWSISFSASLNHTLSNWLPAYRRRYLTRDQFFEAIWHAFLKLPATCGSLTHDESGECPDCDEITVTRNAAWLALADAFDIYAAHGLDAFKEQQSSSDTEKPRFTPGALILKCQVCGADMEVRRSTRLTCSARCRQRLVTLRKAQRESSQSPGPDHGNGA